MKNKPMLQNLSSTGNLGLWTVQNTAIQKTVYLLHTKRCARFGLFKLIWENIKNTTSCIYIYTNHNSSRQISCKKKSKHACIGH